MNAKFMNIQTALEYARAEQALIQSVTGTSKYN
jgi:hypothetical protein